jgi:hypothetical protein
MLSDFHVIDCETREIILAPPNCAFAALSYVWGNHKQPPPSSLGSLPSPAALVVEDAVAATLAIGLRYLWVDQYCIDKRDPETKHYLIQNMDKIYRGAFITLINASGESADAGLPGVSIVPRRAQISTDISDGRRITMVQDIRKETSVAKWSSRAWTYQEGLLSRRKLVFTSSQIYYQCSKMHCCESVSDAFNVSPNHALRDFLQVFPHDGIGYRCDAQTRIHECIQRELSYQPDALDAFMGILQQFWKFRRPVYHFWGLTFDTHNIASAPADAFLDALLWTTNHSTGLLTCTRRANIPSWSLFAWKDIEFTERRREYGPKPYVNVFVGIENQLGVIMDVEDYILDMNRVWNIRRFKPWIHLTGWVTSIRFESGSSIESFIMGGTVHIPTSFDPTTLLISHTCMMMGYSDLITGNRSHDFWSIILFPTENSDGKIVFIAGLILNPVGGDQYERFGVIQNMDVYPSQKAFSTTPGTGTMDQSYLQTMTEYENRTITLV